MSRLRATLLAALGGTALLAASPGDLPTDKTPVADAARAGDRESVRTLLQQGGDVNAAQGDGMTALHWAALAGDVELADMLLYAGANVKASTRLGAYTPLLMATKSGQGSMVSTLLSAGADPNAATTSGTTSLMLAAASGNVDAVTRLLDAGASIDALESSMGQTALMFASAYDRKPVVDVLLARGADPNVTTNVVDAAAIEKEHREARRERQKRLGVFAQGQGGRAEDEEEEGEGEKKSGNVFSKLFRWITPGKGSEEDKDGKALTYGQLVGNQGGMTALHLAARQGHMETVKTLIDAGADVNSLSAGDQTSPLLIATINGRFDLGGYLLDQGADPNLASAAGATPLYAAVNVQWAPKALYPQPRAHLQQQLTYVDFMEKLLDKGADPNVRLKKKLWYSGYNFDLSGVDEGGGTAFWRAAYAGDVEAMSLLKSHGADPNLPTFKPSGRPETGDDTRKIKDVSGIPPVPVGGPAVPPLHAAAGVGYGEGFAANSHHHHPAGLLRAVKYLVEECGADVNAVDHEGNTALHHAASRGDNEMILYLVEKGADVTRVNREGQTTADMANGPVQRVQPFPETVAMLEKLGSKNNHKCVSC
ncbi:MAG: ankyrin repeat domain-containing protein [Vicinamibacteria bacterium]